MSGEILAGSAIVNIALNDRHLQEGLSKAQGTLQRFAARAGKRAPGRGKKTARAENIRPGGGAMRGGIPPGSVPDFPVSVIAQAAGLAVKG